MTQLDRKSPAGHPETLDGRAALNRLEAGPQGWRVTSWADISHLNMALDDLPD